jgi:hypothetical protein
MLELDPDRVNPGGALWLTARAVKPSFLSGVKNRTSLAEGWDNYHACNESRRIQRLQRLEAGGNSQTGSLGWTGAG